MNILKYVWGFFKKEDPRVPIEMDIIEMDIQIEPSKKRKFIYESDSESDTSPVSENKQLYKHNYNKKIKKTRRKFRKYRKVK